jgi:glycosyltransferase involved in cell wall biosynthesis
MNQHLTLEIIISTMNRNDLSFLDKMFPNLDTSLYSILIINQTRLEEDLMSEDSRIRVVNSREFGLSKSRNLGFENAKGDLLLIADDDIEYLPGFENTILEAHKKYDEASLISFQSLNEKGDLVKPYSNKEGYISSTKNYLTSFEMSFKAKHIQEHQLKFNVNFGLGARFICAEEQVIRHDILAKHLKVAFVAQPICVHFGATSGVKMGNPENIKAMTAFKSIQHANLVYLWLLKYVFFLFRHGYISFWGQLKAYKVGVGAVSEFKKCTDEN